MEEFIESKYTKLAIEAVQREMPDGKGFRISNFFENSFYGGTLVIVRFNLEREHRYNVFFDHDGKPGVYSCTEDLAKALSGRRPVSRISRFFQEMGITGFMAILITLTIVFLVIQNPTTIIPQVLSNALTVIIGFYFGTMIKE